MSITNLMGKLYRHQPVINKQSDSDNSEDHWLKQFEDRLVKTSVQPVNRDWLDQISSIVDGKSKFSSVQEKVEEMLERSGMTKYINEVKASENVPANDTKKTAQADNNNAVKKTSTEEKPDQTKVIVFQQKPNIMRTLQNIISSSHGNLPIPTIIDKLHSIHKCDISNDEDWEDDNLLRYVSLKNLEAKQANPANYEDPQDLGRTDNSASDTDIDPSNTDAFHALQPAKM